MIQYPSSLDWLESLFNIEEEKPDTAIVPGRTTSCTSTVAANSGVQTSVSNSPLASNSSVFNDQPTPSSILDIDPNLLSMLLQITDSDISQPSLLLSSSRGIPMNSFEQRSELPSSTTTTSIDDELALGRMKADAARDFNEWKQTKRLIKRLSRHDSAISCCSPPTKKASATTTQK